MIDGYAHCGLSKYRPVEDVLATMQYAGVEQAVLCQHLGEYDNSYLASVVEAHPDKFAAICLVDPTSRTAKDDLDQWCATGRFRGVRLYADWLREHESLYAHAAELGLHLVIYAPDGLANGAAAIDRFAASHDEAKLVVTHLGNPRIEGGRPTNRDLPRLAVRPNVFVQLSGLSMFCDYPHDELSDLIRETIHAFGGSRIYWGSNYPVCGDVEAYRRDLSHLLNGAWNLTSEQIASSTHRTADRLWFSPADTPYTPQAF